MKPRKVIVQLEVLTDAKVKDLEQKWIYEYAIADTGSYFCEITEKPKVNVVKK